MGLKGSAMSCVSIIVLPIPVSDYLLNIFFSNFKLIIEVTVHECANFLITKINAHKQNATYFYCTLLSILIT